MKRGLKIKLPLAFWLLPVMLMMLACCGKNAEQHPSTADVPLVIFDTDIGSSTDDLFALEMLYRYEEQGLCRLLGVVVDREGTECAACADVSVVRHNSSKLGSALSYFTLASLTSRHDRNVVRNERSESFPTTWIKQKVCQTVCLFPFGSEELPRGRFAAKSGKRIFLRCAIDREPLAPGLHSSKLGSALTYETFDASGIYC